MAIVECGIEQYQSLFKGATLFTLSCNRDNGTCEDVILTEEVKERIRALNPPEQDLVKIYEFIDRMALVTSNRLLVRNCSLESC